MTTSNPLETEPTGPSAIPASPAPEPVAAATGSGPAPVPAPKPADAQWSEPQWVEMAAGRALQRAAEAPVLSARRPVELELITRREDDEVAAEARAEAADEPGRLYRTAYASVMAVVFGFFASGTGMCVWVMLRH